MFSNICADPEISTAVTELHISLYMPNLSSRAALSQIEEDAAPSGLEVAHYFRSYIDAHTAELHQSARVVAMNIQALSMTDLSIEHLIIDRRIYTTRISRATNAPLSRLNALDDKILSTQIQALGHCFQSLRVLDLSISEHCVPEPTLRRMWFTKLIESAQCFRILRLMFHHPVSADQLQVFFGLKIMHQLESLTLSTLSAIQNPSHHAAAAKQFSHCRINVSSTISGDIKTIDTMQRLAPNLNLRSGPMKPNYGQFWVTEIGTPFRQRNNWATVWRAQMCCAGTYCLLSPLRHLEIPKVDWRNVCLLIVDRLRGREDRTIYLPTIHTHRGWTFYSVSRARLRLVYLNFNGALISFMSQPTALLFSNGWMDNTCIKTRAFEESVVAANCWSERRSPL